MMMIEIKMKPLSGSAAKRENATFLLHTFLKVVVKPVTTGIAEGSEQEDRLKAALCRI